MKKPINTIIGVLAFVLVYGAVSYTTHHNSITPQATANTDRNSFISGCTPEAAKSTQVNASNFCACAYDKLQNLYGGQFAAPDNLNRIMKDGYSSQETDAIATCIPQPNTLQD